MNNVLDVKHIILNPKEYNGQRVVTFKDIDAVHGRTEGTAARNFRENRAKFIEGADYFVLSGDALSNYKQTTNFVGRKINGLHLITETGYLMLVKSFTDDLAWAVQRELVNQYFKKRESAQPEPKRGSVVDIPINHEYQAAFAEIRKLLNAVEISVQQVNCYRTEKDAMEYARVAEGITAKLMQRVSDLSRMGYKIIPQPY